MRKLTDFEAYLTVRAAAAQFVQWDEFSVSAHIRAFGGVTIRGEYREPPPAAVKRQVATIQAYYVAIVTGSASAHVDLLNWIEKNATKIARMTWKQK